MKRLAVPTLAGPRSWARLWLEVLATDHPILCRFLVLVGFAAGGMFSLILGLGLVVALYELAFGNLAREEGPLFPVFMALYLALAVGVARLSLKAMGTIQEIEGGSTGLADPIKAGPATPPNLYDRDLDEAI